LISTQEKALNVLDKLSIPKIDFKQYLESRKEGEQNVKSPFEYREELHNRILCIGTENGATLPWEYTHSKFRFRPGEVTLWYGINGHKKSMVTGFVSIDLISQGHKVAIASLEMSPTTTLARMMPQAHGRRCNTTDQADEFLDWCAGNLWLYDKRGTVKVDTILGVLYYCAEQLGVTHFFIDSLMKCVRGEDDFNGQKAFVDAVCAAAHDLQIHVHVIHHSKKLADPKARPGKFDAKGSGAIVDQVDNAIAVFQIPEEGKKPDDPDNGIFVDKQRNGEWQGKIMTWFDRDSLQFKSGMREWCKQYMSAST
jgi:twinkle protein